MNEDLHAAIDQPLYPTNGMKANSAAALAAALPAGAFTASVLFEVLALVAETPQQAHSYVVRAVELLNVGLGASLAALGLRLIDSLNVPPATAAGKAATRRLALDGAVVAVYLLGLAARQKQLSNVTAAHETTDSGAIGLSLVGLTLLGASRKPA